MRIRGSEQGRDPAAATMTKFYSEKWKVAEGFVQ